MQNFSPSFTLLLESKKVVKKSNCISHFTWFQQRAILSRTITAKHIITFEVDLRLFEYNMKYATIVMVKK